MKNNENQSVLKNRGVGLPDWTTPQKPRFYVGSGSLLVQKIEWIIHKKAKNLDFSIKVSKRGVSRI